MTSVLIEQLTEQQQIQYFIDKIIDAKIFAYFEII